MPVTLTPIVEINHQAAGRMFDLCMWGSIAPNGSRRHIHPDVKVTWVRHPHNLYEVECNCCKRYWHVGETLLEAHAEKVIDDKDWAGKPIGHMELSLPLLQTLAVAIPTWEDESSDDYF